MDCAKFTDFLSRRSEHLDDEIILSLHPYDNWLNHVNVGRFRAEDGVEHTFDRFENVFPDLRGAWEDVTAASCVGKPCDPDVTLIGLGFTRDSYKLQRKVYATDLFCFDQILSADRAKQQFAHVIKVLRRASVVINSHRLRTEGFRIAKYHWGLANNTLTPLTFSWDSTMTLLTTNVLPTSKLTRKHMARRVIPQVHEGATTVEQFRGSPPMLEFTTDPEILEELKETKDVTWQWTDFAETQQYLKYGWDGKLGNYVIRTDSMPLRFNLKSTNADGTYTFELVFPYANVSATEGIKEELNSDFQNAHFQLDCIWHRMAMTSLVRDTTAINPEMPFAMRDYAGKWAFRMNNLTCGLDTNGNPIAVNNEDLNKGRFKAWFSYATKAERPEFAEWFFHLREPACIVDEPLCSADPGYPAQDYNSANDLCLTENVVITETPVLNSSTGTYEIPRDSILCNGIAILNAPITGTTTITLLVAQLNALVGAMGTWAEAGPNITLTGKACSTINMPWTVA